MTSIAFIMGVVPLVFSSGAGSEMRQAMGIAVFFGMLGVTLFGLMLTPVFYVLLRKLSGVEHLEDKHGTHGHLNDWQPKESHGQASANKSQKAAHYTPAALTE
jgi:multidrug efflux pump